MRTCESGSGSKTVGVRVQMWVREGEEQQWMFSCVCCCHDSKGDDAALLMVYDLHTHTHTYVHACRHACKYICMYLCVLNEFPLVLLCYFVQLYLFFSVSVCKMPNCKCALWIITALRAHYFGFGFIPTLYISVSLFPPFGWHFREIWPQCVTS